MKIHLLADAEYLDHFTKYLKGYSEIELAEQADVVLDCSFLRPEDKRARLAALPANVPILSNTLTLSANSVKGSTDKAIVGIPILPHYFAGQKTVEISLPAGSSDIPEAVATFLTHVGKSTERIQDCVAGIFPRTLAMIVNEGAFAVQESVATAADIDTAMKLGTNYPKGPLAWCDEIGAEVMMAILDALAREYSPERYRVCTLLRRHAEAGTKFLA